MDDFRQHHLTKNAALVACLRSVGGILACDLQSEIPLEERNLLHKLLLCWEIKLRSEIKALTGGLNHDQYDLSFEDGLLACLRDVAQKFVPSSTSSEKGQRLKTFLADWQHEVEGKIDALNQPEEEDDDE